MSIMLWVIASVLAALFLAAEIVKLTQPKDKLAASGMAWTADLGPVRAVLLHRLAGPPAAR